MKLPSAPPKSCPAAAFALDHVPASWKPKRIAPRARPLQRPVFPVKSFVSSAATSYHMQHLSFAQAAWVVGFCDMASEEPDS